MGEKELAAFSKIKQLMTSAPVMKIPDVNKGEFHIHADASRVGLGAVLLQKGDNYLEVQQQDHVSSRAAVNYSL